MRLCKTCAVAAYARESKPDAAVSRAPSCCTAGHDLHGRPLPSWHVLCHARRRARACSPGVSAGDAAQPLPQLKPRLDPYLNPKFSRCLLRAGIAGQPGP